MKKNYKLIITAVFLLAGLNVYAQFKLSGEFRPRTELSHGYGTLSSDDQDASLFTAQRTRLNAFYKNENIKVGLVLQDVRTWGSQRQLVTNEDYATSVHQGWAEVFFTPEFSLKAGRQELIYDDHRIFGSVGWAHQARSHDIAIFKYEKDFKLHVGLAHHENTNRKNNVFDGADAYKNMQYIWYHRPIGKVNFSFLFLNNGVPDVKAEGQEVFYSQTFGTHSSLKTGKWKFATNLYLQTGKTKADVDLSAYNLMVEAVCPRGNVFGFERLSGTSYNDTDAKSFTPFYGTNHKFNGFMDYFYVGNHGGNVGLNDIYFKYNYKKDKFSFGAHIHYFSAAADLAPNADKYLGTELDLVSSWKISPDANISAGWSFMFAGDSMELLKGGSKDGGNYWGWLMLSVTPKFIQ